MNSAIKKSFAISLGLFLLMCVAASRGEVPPQLSSASSTQALQQLQQLQLLANAGQQPSSEAKRNQPQTVAPVQISSNSSNSTVVMPSTYSAAQSAPPAADTPVTNAGAPAVRSGANNPRPTTGVVGSVTEPAFELVTSRLFPLSSAQVVKLHALYNAAELAQVTSPTTPPRPTATSQVVNLSTGSTPPVIRLAQGFVSSLVFLDSTGAPWPIVSYDLGDPRSFNIAWDRSGNTLMIQSNKLYTYGNLAVKLQGLNTPVMLTLIPGQKAVDYRMDLRVQGYGPNAYPAQSQNLPPSANSILLGVLDGVPPPGSKLLEVTGGPADVWEKEDRLYLRTRLKVLSPGWVSVMSSADGMNAYEMIKTPVLLVSWRGKILQLRVEGL